MNPTQGKEDFNPEELAELLIVYYKRLFPYKQFFQWLSYDGEKSEVIWFAALFSQICFSSSQMKNSSSTGSFVSRTMERCSRGT